MRTIVWAAALALGLAGCGMKTDTPENRAATMAKLFNATKGVTGGAAADDLSARAEGRYMVLTIRNALEANPGLTQREADAAITPMICNDENYLNVLQEGVGIKVEMLTNSGEALPPVTVDKCPAKAPAAG